jgi:hypothetical protein
MRRKFISFLKDKGVYNEYMAMFEAYNPNMSLRKFCRQRNKGLWIICAFPIEESLYTNWNGINEEWVESNRKIRNHPYPPHYFEYNSDN